MIEKMIDLEWRMFDKVKNMGERAACQDDYETFYIMRKSQFEVWPEVLQESYYQDLIEADKIGWNMIMEKYARMMETSLPGEFQKVKDKLPSIAEDKKELLEEIVSIQVKWMEEFAVAFPGLASRGRLVHTYEDEVDDTSFETYLRSELCTYSDVTFKLYGMMIVDKARAGLNLSREIIRNTVLLYGYLSLEDAESKIK